MTFGEAYSRLDHFLVRQKGEVAGQVVLPETDISEVAKGWWHRSGSCRVVTDRAGMRSAGMGRVERTAGSCSRPPLTGSRSVGKGDGVRGRLAANY